MLKDKDFEIVAFPKKETDQQVHREKVGHRLVKILVQEFTTSQVSEPPEYAYIILGFSDEEAGGTCLEGNKVLSFELAKIQGRQALEAIKSHL